MKRQSFREWCQLNNQDSLLDEWQYEKNASICTPDSVSYGSKKKVWWKCKNCGHEWETTIYVRAKGHNCPVCAHRKVGTAISASLTHYGKNDLESQAPQLLEEWAYDKNTEISPSTISYKSNKKVWWRCKRCGHEWLASIQNRYNGSRCPRCMRHYHTSYSEQTVYYYVKKEFPDAINSYSPSWLPKTMEIDIFIPSINVGIEYDGEAFHKSKKETKDLLKSTLIKEKGITLIRIREPNLKDIEDGSFIIKTDKPSSNLLFLEKAIELLFEHLDKQFHHTSTTKIDVNRDYDSIIQSVHGLISMKSFGALYPKEASLWNKEKNGSLSPFEFYPHSGIKVWWKCEECGHEWKASIGTIVRGHGCPACAGKAPRKGENDFKTLCPEIASEWSDKNDSLPNQYLPNSGKKVWWKCATCGNEWQATINNRVSNHSGCPKCSLKKQGQTFRNNKIKKRGSFAQNHPELLKEWNYEKNKDICDPNEILSTSHIRANWICSKCGHEWSAFVYSRTAGRGCPACKARNMRKDK